MVTIESAGISDVGRKRKNNEDAFLIDHHQKLYIVADGMGGHNAGDVASQLTVDIIKRHMNGDAGDEEHESMDLEETLSVEANRLLAGIQLANQGVYQAAQEDEKYNGMGSTVSAVYFAGDCLTAANVGDSPIYLIHERTIEPLYVPHTVIAEREAIDPDDVGEIEEKYRHMLTRAIGTREKVVPDACAVKCFKGDILVVCSDGLSDKVPQEEICNIASGDRPDKACQLLVDLANERGGDDNITVIILRVKSVSPGRNCVIGWMTQFFRRRIRIDMN